MVTKEHLPFRALNVRGGYRQAGQVTPQFWSTSNNHACVGTVRKQEDEVVALVTCFHYVMLHHLSAADSAGRVRNGVHNRSLHERPLMRCGQREPDPAHPSRQPVRLSAMRQAAGHRGPSQARAPLQTQAQAASARPARAAEQARRTQAVLLGAEQQRQTAAQAQKLRRTAGLMKAQAAAEALARQQQGAARAAQLAVLRRHLRS